MAFSTTIRNTTFRFENLRTLMAKATPERSGDQLAGIAADGPVERLAAQMALADVPLRAFLAEELIPSDSDEVSALIAAQHDPITLIRPPPASRYISRAVSLSRFVMENIGRDA